MILHSVTAITVEGHASDIASVHVGSAADVHRFGRAGQPTRQGIAHLDQQQTPLSRRQHSMGSERHENRVSGRSRQ